MQDCQLSINLQTVFKTGCFFCRKNTVLDFFLHFLKACTAHAPKHAQGGGSQAASRRGRETMPNTREDALHLTRPCSLCKFATARAQAHPPSVSKNRCHSYSYIIESLTVALRQSRAASVVCCECAQGSGR